MESTFHAAAADVLVRIVIRTHIEHNTDVVAIVDLAVGVDQLLLEAFRQTGAMRRAEIVVIRHFFAVDELRCIELPRLQINGVPGVACGADASQLVHSGLVALVEHGEILLLHFVALTDDKCTAADALVAVVARADADLHDLSGLDDLVAGRADDRLCSGRRS